LTQFYLEDTWLKELKTTEFAPGGDILVFEWLVCGVSILALMNWTSSAIMEEKEDTEVWTATRNTRTEEQVRRHNSKKVRDLPKEWSKLKVPFNTYCILLRALFTMHCEHFKNCWTLCNAIAQYHGENEKHFNADRGYLSKLLVWRVLVDSRGFFSKKDSRR